MTTNGHSLNNGYSLRSVKTEETYTYLKNKTSKISHATLWDYIETVCKELSEDQSFYVLDLADILWKTQLWYEKLPGVTPYYAVKANPDPVLVRLFVLLGLSFDCSTKGEIDLILKHGGNPKKIIYAHTIKSPSSLKYAAEVGVDLLTFDDEEELIKIQNNFPTARLILRIKADTPSRSYDLSKKYGCPVEKTRSLLCAAKELNLNVVGVSFHVGALCGDPKVYTKTIECCRTVFKTAEKLGFRFHILDLGAGFYGSAIRENFFHEVTSEIKEALRIHFPESDIQVIAEPGCYFVASSQRHVTCVLGSKTIEKLNSNKKLISNGQETSSIQRHYYLNDGLYGSFFMHNEIYDVTPIPLISRNELDKRAIYKSKVWGQTCCSEDVIQEECSLPELKVGEYVVWENMGAYSQGVSSTFTVVPSPIAKRVFIKNPRLYFEWIDKFKEVFLHIAENTTLIESEDFP